MRTYFFPLFSSFLDAFHDFLLGKRSRLKTVVMCVTIKIDALPIKMNLCQGLLNYMLICQLPSPQEILIILLIGVALIPSFSIC